MNPIDLSSLAGLTLTDDIQLIEQIGAGGMGVVYRGVQKSLNRAVCVKFMQSDLVSSLEWQHRFRREAQVLAGIRHKHLARVYAVGFYQSVYPYLVMELLNGSTLNKLIKQQGTLPWRTAAELIIQICDAMSCVHEQGFVHRDLKPDNVLVIEEDRKLSSKILDFGLVGRHTKAEDTRTLTGTGDLLGTVLYMAPECFQQAQHLPSVDMYAIGCMLYEMLSGSPPFDGDSPVAIALKHNKGDIPALNSIIGTAEERVYLETVIKQSCSKNPAHRPTCEQLSQSLQCALQGDFQTEKIVVATDTHTNTNAGADKSLLRRHTAAIATFLASCAALAVFLFHPSALLTGGSVVDLQAHLAKARQELKDRHDVQAATILKEYMLNPKLKARDKFEAQMLLVETSIHRRTMELAQTQLVAAIDTLSTLEPPILDAQSTRVLHLVNTVIERAGQSKRSLVQLLPALSQLLKRSDITDRCIKHIALLSAEIALTPELTVRFTEKQQMPGYADAAELLLKLPASLPEPQKLYTKAAQRMAQKMPQKDEREAVIFLQLSLRLLSENDLRGSLQLACRSVEAMDHPRSDYVGKAVFQRLEHSIKDSDSAQNPTAPSTPPAWLFAATATNSKSQGFYAQLIMR